jgi:hypothetical protein
MATTQFEQNAINTAAGKHDEMVEALRARLRKLEGVVQDTLGRSPSGATRALESTYNVWIADVEKMFVEKANQLTTSMRKTAESQMDVDEQNKQGISQIAAFING